MQTRLRRDRFSRVDVAALVAFVALWVFYIIVVRYGVCYPDEHCYTTFSERLLRGDRPLVDEWNTAHLGTLWLLLPHKLFVALTGSTDGIILFQRYLFLAFNAVFYWIMYIRLRAYGWIDLAATVLFCAFIPGGLFSCNYYTVPVRLIMIACLILFAEKRSPLSLLAAGFLLACSVVSQPGLVLLYLGYSALVWIRFFRQKKGRRFLDDYAFCLQARAWMYISLTALLCAAVFCIWLFAKSGLRNILTAIPYMLTDAEYDYSAQGSAWTVFFRKSGEVIFAYSRTCLLLFLALLLLSIAYARGWIRARRNTVRKILFCAACALWIASCILPLRFRLGNIPEILFKVYSLPLSCFGLLCYLLCEKKNKRFFFFWIVGLCVSLCIDMVSAIALSLGTPIAYIADLVFFVDLTRELRADPSAEKIRNAAQLRAYKTEKRFAFAARLTSRITCLCFAGWFAFVLLGENTVFPAHCLLGTPLFSFPYVCEKGPCRSLHYPDGHWQNYNHMLADIDTIRESRPSNLFVCGAAPELYLYADLPYASNSAWGWRDTPNYLQRQILYWQLHPERLPSCIYAPFNESNCPLRDEAHAEETLAWLHDAFDPICDYTLQRGEGGYILYVSHWDLHTEAAVQ